jgi:hypothetical protein
MPFVNLPLNGFSLTYLVGMAKKYPLKYWIKGKEKGGV